MGCDSTSDLPTKRQADVNEFLLLLGYTAFGGRLKLDDPWRYVYYPEADYAFLAGVTANVYLRADGIRVHTRTQLWRSKTDSDFQNFTIRQLKKRFGGTFQTDAGTNRYFRYDGPDRRDAEAGVYRSYFTFQNNHATAGVYLQNMSREGSFNYKEMPLAVRHAHASVNLGNMLVPFLVAMIEEFFRSSYVAILRYSPRREQILKDVRLSVAEIASYEGSGLTLDDVAARRMSFQSVSKVSEQFKNLDKRFDVAGWLRAPYRRRRESLHASIERLVEQRHALAHRAEMNPLYDYTAAKRDHETLGAAAQRVYKHLVRLNSWAAEEAG